MREMIGDLWNTQADARCITTNGTIKKNGALVMGRGCAKEAAQRFSLLPIRLGNQVSIAGNHVHVDMLPPSTYILITFPVKHNWWEKADIELIRQSAHELMNLDLMKSNALQDVLLPRPGCGNGGLDWFTEVKPVIESILDDRVIVISK